MSSIHLLPDTLINKIAAGEVVERPASVVKELVENSLDAHATHIEVDIKEGGKKLILVRDDGVGIHPDQLRLAVSRHTTSKIQKPDDLFAIQTLGFRGEALASMAAVSQFKMTSRLRDSELPAREIQIEGGKVVSEHDAGHPFGTSVLVKYLFCQTPARLKFLKSTETEMSHISDYVTKVALAYPQITLRLMHQDKRVLLVNQTDSIQKRVLDVFGKELSEASYDINYGQSGIEINGLTGHPQISRSHGRQMYLYVNGRPVRDRVIYHAVFEAYRDLLMKGRYPFIILFLKVPPMMVDVNVHPAKNEVRFANTSVIHRAVYEAVRSVLTKSPWQNKKARRDAEELGNGKVQNESLTDHQIFSEISRSMELSQPSGQPVIQEAYSQKKIEFGKTPYANMEVLGQLMGTYILCQAEDQLILIDQHAAHERIGFEKLMLQHQEGEVQTQNLLLPENFDLNPSETEIIKKYLLDLQSFGLEIEYFGGHTFVVKSVPLLLHGKIKIRELMIDLVGDVLEKGKLTTLHDHVHALLARMACHGAIRAHHLLTKQEMEALLKELDQYQMTSFCPHGRPVSVEVTRYEIEKWFKRIL